MVKGELQNGTHMFVVRIEHFVKLADFARALCQEFYNKNSDFDKNLSKKEAEKILKHRLFFHGLHGELEDGHFESSFEESETYNAILNDAIDWVSENYKWLAE